MSKIDELRREAARIRNRLLNPPNAVTDRGIDLTRKSTAYKGDELPPGTPPKKKLVPEVAPIPIRIPLGFDDIFREVCSFYEVDRSLVMSRDRRTKPVMVRRIIVYLALKMLQNRSLSSIARDLSRDHTTIIHARDSLRDLLLKNPRLLEEISLIEEKILASHSFRYPVPAKRECSVEEQSWTGPPG